MRVIHGCCSISSADPCHRPFCYKNKLKVPLDLPVNPYNTVYIHPSILELASVLKLASIVRMYFCSSILWKNTHTHTFWSLDALIKKNVISDKHYRFYCCLFRDKRETAPPPASFDDHISPPTTFNATAPSFLSGGSDQNALNNGILFGWKRQGSYYGMGGISLKNERYCPCLLSKGWQKLSSYQRNGYILDFR